MMHFTFTESDRMDLWGALVDFNLQEAQLTPLEKSKENQKEKEKKKLGKRSRTIRQTIDEDMKIRILFDRHIKKLTVKEIMLKYGISRPNFYIKKLDKETDLEEIIYQKELLDGPQDEI